MSSKDFADELIYHRSLTGEQIQHSEITVGDWARLEDEYKKQLMKGSFYEQYMSDPYAPKYQFYKLPPEAFNAAPAPQGDVPITKSDLVGSW